MISPLTLAGGTRAAATDMRLSTPCAYAGGRGFPCRVDHRQEPAAVDGALAAALGFALLLPTLVPVYLHYAAAGGEQRVDARENQQNSVDLLRVLSPLADSPLHTAVFGSRGQSSSPALPGYALSIAGLGGLWLRRRTPAWRLVALGGVGCFVLALGSPLQFDGHDSGLSGPWILVDLLTQNRLRGPDRWLVYSHLALALGAGAALAALPARVRWPAALALTTFFVLESPHPRRSAAPHWPAAVVEAAAGIPGSGPLWNIPRHDGCADAEYLAALTLERPLVGGNYARFDEALSTVNRLTRTWPSRPALAWARENVGLVVEHPPLRGDDPPGFRCVLAAGHRLCAPPDLIGAPAGSPER